MIAIFPVKTMQYLFWFIKQTNINKLPSPRDAMSVAIRTDDELVLKSIKQQKKNINYVVLNHV